MMRTNPYLAGNQVGLLRRLARDRSGNTLALLAAAILPLLGLVGGGVDMGRAYLASSRLQQACDAGVLAARKKLGSSAPVTGSVPTDVGLVGQRFFNINFRQGAYGTENRSFTMTLENDYAISGRAEVSVPTSIMGIFGYEEVPVVVECQSLLNFSSLDVMMVLDVTGSMRHTNAGDSQSRIDSLKQVIRNFYTELETSKSPGSDIRYGFVPYATNVNVGHLLQDDWVTDSWTYQSREDTGKLVPSVKKVTTENWQFVSGSRADWSTISSYAGTFVPPKGSDEVGTYRCEGTQPASTWTYADVVENVQVKIQLEPKGLLTIEEIRRTSNGSQYRTIVSGNRCEVQQMTDTAYVETYERHTYVPSLGGSIWRYKPVTIDTSGWRLETDGCIEERSTYKIDNYNAVDMDRALDLDIDLVPSAGDPDTQWRPRYPEMIYVRRVLQNGTGSVQKAPHTTEEIYADTGNWWFSDCPAPARKLASITADELDAYLATLAPYGATYHDIGMIWGARLLSPTGLFSAENGSVGGRQKTRHLVFLTDGQTEPYDLSYGAYGVDALDQRRWEPGDSRTLAKSIEERFLVACNEIKKRNVTVWVIAFGTHANQSMVDCAGNGRYFEASNATELNDAFTTIARSMADLRLSQ